MEDELKPNLIEEDKKEPAIEEQVAEPKNEPVVQEQVVEPKDEPVVQEQVVEPKDEPVVQEQVVEPKDEPVIEEQIDEPDPEEQNPILHEYGRTLSGTQVIEEAEKGNVPEEEVILMTNKHSLPITDSELAVEPKEVLDFYDAERLEHMNEENTLTPEFTKLYNENVISTLSNDEKAEHYTSLVEESKAVSEETKSPYDQLIFDYYMAGILPAEYTGSSFDFNFIKNKFEKGAIKYDTIVDLYNNDIISSKQFLKLLEIKQVETKDLFTGNVMSEQELKLITSEKKADIFSTAIEENKLTVEELMDLYLYRDAIKIYDLKKALIKGKVYESLAPYLSQNTDKFKIQELYVNFLIDYNTLIMLKREHIISEDEFDTMKTKIDRDKFYEDLANTKDLYIHTTPDNISSSISHFYKAGTEEKQDFKQEQQMLSELYGVDKSYEDYTTIHATDLDGNPTSLDGYTCLPMPRFDVVTLKKFNTDSDTFIMPYQQAAYFLHNSYKPTEYYEGSQSELDITNRPEEENGYGAEIPLPFEDYNDADSIQVVASGLNYARQLFDAIYELAGSDEARDALKEQGRPTPTAEKYLQTSNLNQNHEREEIN